MNSTSLAGDSFSWVLQTSWQAGVLVLLVLIVQMIFRQKLSPAWRYGLWLLVVVRLLMPAAPQTACSIFNVVKFPPPLARVESASLPWTPVPPLPSADEKAKTDLKSRIGAFETPASLRSDQAERLPGTARGNLASVTILDWHWVALLVWLLGSCFFATRLLWSNLRFWLRIATEPAVTNESARKQVEDCRSELGIRRAVDLIETEAVESPAVHGLWRKRLLVPKGSFDRFSAEQVRCIFLHELAHIKRRDLEVNWLVSVLQALHWFNPLLWFGFARMRADREMACDSLALSHLGKAPSESYGETIIKVVENLVRPPSAAGLLALSEDKRQLEERIRMIAAFRGRPGLSVLALSLIIGIGVVGLTDASRARSSTATPGDLRVHQSTNLVVKIDAKGDLTLGQTPVIIDRLRTNLVAELAKHPKLRLEIRADKGAPLEAIVTVMDLMKEAGSGGVTLGSGITPRSTTLTAPTTGQSAVAAARRVLSSKGASELAARLANEQCERLYRKRPFSADQHAAVLQDGLYHWGGLDAGGVGGFSALVTFRQDGSEPHIEVYYSNDSR